MLVCTLSKGYLLHLEKKVICIYWAILFLYFTKLCCYHSTFPPTIQAEVVRERLSTQHIHPQRYTISQRPGVLINIPAVQTLSWQQEEGQKLTFLRKLREKKEQMNKDKPETTFMIKTITCQRFASYKSAFSVHGVFHRLMASLFIRIHLS